MAHLGNVSGREAVKAFCKAGYVVQRQTASHIILHKPGYPPLSIPDHRELSPNLLRAQIKLADLSVEQFMALL